VAVYVLQDFGKIGEPGPDREIVAHGFFALMTFLTTAGTRRRIVEVVGGAPVSERW
jgi:hypothetical protein